MLKQLMIVMVLSVFALGGCAKMAEVPKEADKRIIDEEAKGASLVVIDGKVWSEKMEALKNEVEQATAGTDVVVTKMDDNRLKVEIPSDISFAIGKATVEPRLSVILDPFALSLTKHETANVTITGHTDSTGSDAINNPLSLKRATSVRDYLVAKGIDMNRFSAYGRGSTHPIAPNDTSANRAKNRRVELYVEERAPIPVAEVAPQS